MAKSIFALSDGELEQISGGRYTGPTFVYVIQPNDNLTILSQRYGTTVRVLRELNGLDSPNMVKPGTSILIPQR